MYTHRSHGRIGSDDPRPKAGSASNSGRRAGWRGLLWAKTGECLAELESTEGRGITGAIRPIDGETTEVFLLFRRRVVGNHNLRFRGHGVGGAGFAGNFS